MDASKLLNILIDLTNGEEKNISDTLNTLVNNISSNQSEQISLNAQ